MLHWMIFKNYFSSHLIIDSDNGTSWRRRAGDGDTGAVGQGGHGAPVLVHHGPGGGAVHLQEQLCLGLVGDGVVCSAGSHHSNNLLNQLHLSLNISVPTI